MLRVAVDIGGTFTDLVAIDDRSFRRYVLKVKSTPTRPEDGFVSALRRFLSENKLDASEVGRIVHVGTIGSNLFLGQLGIKVPKTALVTTRGFRDVIEIGRQNRSELYNVFFQRPRPLVPRKLRFDVAERTDSNGRILKIIDPSELHGVGEGLKAEGVEAVAISFINSYLNPENEAVAKRLLSDTIGFVFASSDVCSEHREYERTSTTVVNAVLAPVISRYLDSALGKLKDLGVNAPVLLLSSSGGLVDIEEAKIKPIVAVESGPAAGVVGAAEIAKVLGAGHVLSLDMGGTTAKAGCIVDYVPLVIPEMEIGGRVQLGRTIKGSGYPVRYPSVDLAEVSAGGGTIIWADEIGSLNVGPLSAGAEPGPACYGAGGKNPTITDANLILGRLGPTLLGREIQLEIKYAINAMKTVAKKTQMDFTEAAAASLRLVNLHMARAVDIVSLERGHDPSKFSLIAFGGAGPMHAAELSEQVGVNRVIVPPYPGLFSALGMMMTDMKYAYVRGLLKPLDELRESLLEEMWQEMASSALAHLKSRSVDVSVALTLRSADVRYFGQGYELEIPALAPVDLNQLEEAFGRKHEMVYGYRHQAERLEVTALRLTVIIPVMKASLGSPSRSSPAKSEPEGYRKVWFNNDWVESSLYWRERIATDKNLSGPAIIEEYDSTIVLPPDWECNKQQNNCLVLERKS
jgi:N-methylhydantoinase A